MYATLSEMQKLLKDKYKEIQRYRNKHLPVSIKRDHRKDVLPKMIDAYVLEAQGKNSVLIAKFLDEKYKDENTFENVYMLVKRIKEEAKRFD